MPTGSCERCGGRTPAPLVVFEADGRERHVCSSCMGTFYGRDGYALTGDQLAEAIRAWIRTSPKGTTWGDVVRVFELRNPSHALQLVYQQRMV